MARRRSLFKLDKADATELLKWVTISRLERVASVAASLTNASGERGKPEKPETLLLLKIAHLKRKAPNRKLHSIALSVAREALPHRIPLISLESLVSKLERDFRRQRHTWMKLAASTPCPSLEEIARNASKQQSIGELRALSRIIDLLPSAIDLYDALLADAKRLGPAEAKLVKFVGRERAEPMLVEAIKKQQTSSFVVNSRGMRMIPRSFFDLIERDLELFRAAHHRSTKLRQEIGPKSAN